jgi:hypothetical protein
MWLQQYAPDHLRIHVPPSQEFEGRHGVPVQLEQDAVFDDLVLPMVEPGVGRFGNW